MTYVLVALLGAVNAVIFFFGSIFALAADGARDRDAWTIWAIGFSWLAVVLVSSLWLVARERKAAALVFSVAALPIVAVATLLLVLAVESYRRYRPVSAGLALTCRSAGESHFSKPSAPVHSVAFVWREGSQPPDITAFEFDSWFNMSEVRQGPPLLPKAIAFTQTLCCWAQGRPLQAEGPYVVHTNPRSGNYTTTGQITADILVMLETTPAHTTEPKSDLTKVSAVVEDRRTGNRLAEMTYFYDAFAGKGCGASSAGLVSVGDFMARSTGIPPDQRMR